MKKTFTGPLFALAGVLFLHQGIACSDDDGDDLGTEIDCSAYCDRANECNDIDEEECELDCRDTLDSCMDDEREAAQDQLDMCADVACDEFTECTIDAGAQCFFGL